MLFNKLNHRSPAFNKMYCDYQISVFQSASLYSLSNFYRQLLPFEEGYAILASNFCTNLLLDKSVCDKFIGYIDLCIHPTCLVQLLCLYP